MKTNKIIKNNNFLLGFIAGILVGFLVKPFSSSVVIGSYNGNCKNRIADKKHKK